MQRASLVELRYEMRRRVAELPRRAQRHHQTPKMAFRRANVGVHLHASFPPVRAELAHGLLDGHLGHELLGFDAPDLVQGNGLDELVGSSRPALLLLEEARFFGGCRSRVVFWCRGRRLVK